jgi:hypothetical protein
VMVRIPSRGKALAWRLSAPVKRFLTSNNGTGSAAGSRALLLTW